MVVEVGRADHEGAGAGAAGQARGFGVEEQQVARVDVDLRRGIVAQRRARGERQRPRRWWRRHRQVRLAQPPAGRDFLAGPNPNNVVEGKSWSVRGNLGGRRYLKNKNKTKQTTS